MFNPDPERPWVGTVVDMPGEVVRAAPTRSPPICSTRSTLSDQLLVSGGVRWEQYKSRFVRAAARRGDSSRTDRNLTWRAGITYKPMRRLSLYAGAGTSVNPSIENMTQTTPTAALVALEARAQPHL